MSKRSKQEPFLLGVVVGTIASIGIVVLLSLSGVFGGDDPDTANAQPAPTVTVLQGTATAGNGAGNGNGRGNGNGGGNGNGFGSNGVDLEPLSQGVASPEVVAVFEKAGCVACHSVRGVGGGAATIGPSLSRMGVVATVRPGSSPEAYLRESIVDPDAYVIHNCPTGACPAGLMPQTFAEILTESELSTIVDYLAVLGTAAEADVLGEPAG